MGERVIVRQDRNFIIQILAVDPHEPESEALQQVDHIHQLTPYGMLMTSLGSCTAIVLHTYAQHHDIGLEQVAVELEYSRIFAEDCADCEEIDEYKEHIRQEVSVSGDLTERDRDRLDAISRHCSIHKILTHGLEVESHLAEE
jgi:putative redox protein